MIKKIKDKALHYWSNHKIETIVFIVLVIALLIILICLLAIFVRPAHHTPLKLDSKDFILPKPKPKHE